MIWRDLGHPHNLKAVQDSTSNNTQNLAGVSVQTQERKLLDVSLFLLIHKLYTNTPGLHLRDDGGLVDVLAVAPPVRASLLLQVGEVDVAWAVSLHRQIPDHIQPVSAAFALLLFAIHHLKVT